MRSRSHRVAAVVVAAMVVVSACGLDDGARIRNQDNVREGTGNDWQVHHPPSRARNQSSLSEPGTPITTIWVSLVRRSRAVKVDRAPTR